MQKSEIKMDEDVKKTKRRKRLEATWMGRQDTVGVQMLPQV